MPSSGICLPQTKPCPRLWWPWEQLKVVLWSGLVGLGAGWNPSWCHQPGRESCASQALGKERGAEGLGQGLAPDLEMEPCSLFLSKVSFGQLSWTSPLGLDWGASKPVRLLCILQTKRALWTQIWWFALLVLFNTYSESLKTIMVVNSTDCKCYDKVEMKKWLLSSKEMKKHHTAQV